MTTVAEKFIQELQQGQISEAIETIAQSLQTLTKEKILESRQEILDQYGFVQIQEAKDNDDKKKKAAVTQDQGEGDESKDSSDDTEEEEETPGDDGGGEDDGEGDDE